MGGRRNVPRAAVAGRSSRRPVHRVRHLPMLARFHGQLNLPAKGFSQPTRLGAKPPVTINPTPPAARSAKYAASLEIAAMVFQPGVHRAHQHPVAQGGEAEVERREQVRVGQCGRRVVHRANIPARMAAASAEGEGVQRERTVFVRIVQVADARAPAAAPMATNSGSRCSVVGCACRHAAPGVPSRAGLPRSRP